MNIQKSMVGVLAITASLGLLSPPATAKDLLYAPDHRVVHIKGGALQPDLSQYRSPLDSKVVDRRFYTNDATYMANEGFKMGMEGYNDFVKAGMPVAYRRAFQWVTAKEAYFYARFVLDYAGARGHAGVNMVQGPYWTLQAERFSRYNRLQRDRGERAFSNKDVMLGMALPLVYQRTGFPRVFDDTALSYLQYKAVDPHFSGFVSPDDSYVDPMSGKKGGWGQPEGYFNNYPQRFDHDKMDTTLDMGAIGQFVKRRMQWADYFFHSEHKDESPVSVGTEVDMLGNDAEEGLRGWALAMGSVNAILEVKSSLFTDGEKLMGINPAKYDPAQGLRYIPHEIAPNILWVGDMPERILAVELKDNSSQLWDQASWIWGATTFSTTVKHRPKFYTDNPPVDGGLMEKSLGEVAESLTNTVFKNIQAMHTRDGILVSSWTPAGKTGTTISLRDMAMTLAALRDMEQGWEYLEKYSEFAEQARTLIKSNADFLLKVQGADGSFAESYQVADGQPVGERNLSAPNWAGIRGLLAAWFTTENEAYLKAARRTFNRLNRDYWVEAQGVYRTRLGDDTVAIDPYGLGIAMAAMREMLFVTPTHRVDAQIERFTRWWIQSVDNSGSMQSESERTGEIYPGFLSGDDDGDGVPVATRAHGKHGIAPLIAGKVVINVGGAGNAAFEKIAGETHDPGKFTPVRMSYRPQTAEQQAAIQVPETYPDEPGLAERGLMERADGTLIALPPSKPVTVGLGTALNLSGRQIFESNCAACHGQYGEGIDGLPLAQDIDRTHDAMFKIVNAGRFAQFMPPWGEGNADGFSGALTKDEIDKVVSYVQSDGFRADNQALERGEVPAGSLPRDVWFYLSRENAKAHGTNVATADDAKRYFAQHPDPAKLEAPSYENIARLKPDADLSLADRQRLRQLLGLDAADTLAQSRPQAD